MHDFSLHHSVQPFRGVPGALTSGVKRQEHEADYLLPCRAEAKKGVELYLHSEMSSIHNAELTKHRDNISYPNQTYGRPT